MLCEYSHLFAQFFLVLGKLVEIFADKICKFPINVFPHGKMEKETDI